MVKSESYIFLLKENVHSMAIFKDDIKVNKFHEVILEAKEEEKFEMCTFKLDSVIHENTFKSFLTPPEYISKRVEFLTDVLWKNHKLWSDQKNYLCKVILIQINKSIKVFESILSTIHNAILHHQSTGFTINLYYHINGKRSLKLQWSSSDSMVDFSDLKSKVHQETNSFYSQNDSKLFECEVKINTNITDLST